MNDVIGILGMVGFAYVVYCVAFTTTYILIRIVGKFNG